MSDTSWLLSSLSLTGGVLLFDLDQPGFKGDDLTLGSSAPSDSALVDSARFIVSRLVVYRVETKLLLNDRMITLVVVFLSLPHLAPAFV